MGQNQKERNGRIRRWRLYRTANEKGLKGIDFRISTKTNELTQRSTFNRVSNISLFKFTKIFTDIKAKAVFY